MNDINSDNFLRELEIDPPSFSIINHPLIDQEDSQTQWQAIDDTTFDVEDLLNLISPPTAAVQPPPDIRSPPAQQCDLTATSASNNNPTDSEADGTKKRARLTAKHTLSARKRRVRFNESFKALQDLVPNCNKSDRASILDNIAEQYKSLQLQNQMLQQYIEGMEIGMNNMRMGMNQASNLMGPMWSPQVAPGLNPYHQVPNLDQRFNGVQQEQLP